MQNGTIALIVDDGITRFYEETFDARNEPLMVNYEESFRSTAPIQVSMNRENFIGNLTFDVECS